MNNVPLLNSGEQTIKAGMVIISYTRLRVAGVHPITPISTSDEVIFSPSHPGKKRRPCRVTVTSLEVDHQQVQSVQPGELCGIELGCSCSELPRPGDEVYLVQAAVQQDESGYPPRALVDSVPDADLAP